MRLFSIYLINLTNTLFNFFIPKSYLDFHKGKTPWIIELWMVKSKGYWTFQTLNSVVLLTGAEKIARKNFHPDGKSAHFTSFWEAIILNFGKNLYCSVSLDLRAFLGWTERIFSDWFGFILLKRERYQDHLSRDQLIFFWCLPKDII